MATTLPQSSPLSVLYCTDENIAVRVGSTDWYQIVIKDQRLAYGTNGFIHSSRPWVLSCPSVRFQAAGVQRGHVVSLSSPATRFPSSGEIYAVESALDHHHGSHLTLRRLGLQTGQGQPPGAGADINGVTFDILTLGPQIENNCYLINQQYSIDPTDPARSPDNIWDKRDLRDLTVLNVICDRLLAMITNAAGSAATVRLDVFRREESEIRSRVHLRWINTTKPTSPFSMRITR